MSEEFEFRDLSDAVFWGVDLKRATFRDVDLTGVRISHARLVDVEIDAEVDRLVVNGVDVTQAVHAGDVWYPLRSQVRPDGPDATRAAWRVFVRAWSDAIERVGDLPEASRHASVGGEWSFVQTLRHLVFAIDKWVTVPVVGGGFHTIGLPNTGSADFGWPGLDASADPTFDDAVAAWRDRAGIVTRYLEGVGADALAASVDVMENGPHAAGDCIGTVLEEHFEHLRYATRDLARLG